MNMVFRHENKGENSAFQEKMHSQIQFKLEHSRLEYVFKTDEYFLDGHKKDLEGLRPLVYEYINWCTKKFGKPKGEKGYIVVKSDPQYRIFSVWHMWRHSENMYKDFDEWYGVFSLPNQAEHIKKLIDMVG